MGGGVSRLEETCWEEDLTESNDGNGNQLDQATELDETTATALSADEASTAKMDDSNKKHQKTIASGGLDPTSTNQTIDGSLPNRSYQRLELRKTQMGQRDYEIVDVTATATGNNESVRDSARDSARDKEEEASRETTREPSNNIENNNNDNPASKATNDATNDDTILYIARPVKGTLAWFDVLTPIARTTNTTTNNDSDSNKEDPKTNHDDNNIQSRLLLRVVALDVHRKRWRIYKYHTPAFPGQLPIPSNDPSRKGLDSHVKLYKTAALIISWSRYVIIAARYGPPTQEDLLQFKDFCFDACHGTTNDNNIHSGTREEEQQQAGDGDDDNNKNDDDDDWITPKEMVQQQQQQLIPTNNDPSDGGGVEESKTESWSDNESDHESDHDNNIDKESANNDDKIRNIASHTAASKSNQCSSSRAQTLKLRSCFGDVSPFRQSGMNTTTPDNDGHADNNEKNNKDRSKPLEQRSSWLFRSNKSQGNTDIGNDETKDSNGNVTTTTGEDPNETTKNHVEDVDPPMAGVLDLDGDNQPILQCQEISNKMMGNHQTFRMTKEDLLGLLKLDQKQQQGGDKKNESNNCNENNSNNNKLSVRRQQQQEEPEAVSTKDDTTNNDSDERKSSSSLVQSGWNWISSRASMTKQKQSSFHSTPLNGDDENDNNTSMIDTIESNDQKDNSNKVPESIIDSKEEENSETVDTIKTNCAAAAAEISPGDGVEETKEEMDNDPVTATTDAIESIDDPTSTTPSSHDKSNSDDDDDNRTPLPQPLVSYFFWKHNTWNPSKHKMYMHLAEHSDLAMHTVLAIVANQVRSERNNTFFLATGIHPSWFYIDPKNLGATIR